MEGKCPFNGKPCDKMKNIHVSSNVNGEVSECDYCQDCGSKFTLSFALMPISTMSIVMPMPSVLLNNFAKLSAMDDETNHPRCLCGYSVQDIKKIGRAGCPTCYDTFKDDFINVMPKMHAGGICHKGKTPKNNVEFLRKQMAKVITEERYEEAAQLRDRIKVLDQKVIQGHDLETPH